MTVAAFVALLTAVKPVIQLLVELKEVLNRKGELTPEAESHFDDLVKSLQNDATKPPHWRIDP